MSINNTHCIFLDIDGTILGSNYDAFEENINTIKILRSMGHKVFISTGRATAYMPEELNLSDDFDGVISGAGAVSKMGDRILAESLIPYNIVLKYADFAMEHKLPAVIEGQNSLYHFGFSGGVDNDHISIIIDDKWTKLDKSNIKDILTPDVPIEKLTVLGDIPLELDSILGDEYIILRFKYHGEIIQKNRGKGKALLEVAEILDIPIERTIAIGDSMNDFDMIKAAGIGIAMGNANDELKQAADMIADDVDSAGVSKILKKIFCLR